MVEYVEILKKKILENKKILGFRENPHIKVVYVYNIKAGKDIPNYIEVSFCGGCRYLSTSPAYARAKKVLFGIRNSLRIPVLFKDFPV
ncbi:MAG: hypothetical protein BV456_00605 [Thermoplasmata archaeon M8B2D]|nr:MAG: hypothetical protein BV456_00605 [Thermoplasmata archaeon M8B2D]